MYLKSKKLQQVNVGVQAYCVDCKSDCTGGCEGCGQTCSGMGQLEVY